jgi:elongation factor G
MPEAQRQDFIVELRGLTQGLGGFTHAFDHMAELPARLIDEVKRLRA